MGAGKKGKGVGGGRFAAGAPEPRTGKPGGVNPRLAAQTRKRLGKHYASKYRVRGRP